MIRQSSVISCAKRVRRSHQQSSVRFGGRLGLGAMAVTVAVAMLRSCPELCCASRRCPCLPNVAATAGTVILCFATASFGSRPWIPPQDSSLISGASLPSLKLTHDSRFGSRMGSGSHPGQIETPCSSAQGCLSRSCRALVGPSTGASRGFPSCFQKVPGAASYREYLVLKDVSLRLFSVTRNHAAR